MRERLKSAVLFVLVGASLIQSYVLAYGTPKFELVNQTDYIPTELTGTQANVEDVVYPEQIVVHSGNKKHTVLPIQMSFYHIIYNEFLQQRRFEGFHRTNTFGSSLNMEAIRNDSPGLEIKFREAVPLSVLQRVMEIKEEAPIENDYIAKIWIYIDKNKDEVKALFFSESNLVVYEAVKADLDAAKIQTFVNFGEYQPSYHTEVGDYYLPDEPVEAMQYKMPYTELTADKLKRSLFADPAMVSLLQEKNDTQFYTDAKRGLQMKSAQHWLAFTDPVSAPVNSKNDVKENMLSAISFINQHEGWNGNYLYSELSPKQGTGPQTIVFRQYIDNYPIINTKQDLFGYIKVVLNKGIVSNYERSTILMDKPSSKTQVTLPGARSSMTWSKPIPVGRRW
ncbi:two-component system activity regulator YycH [Paenibacillus sp. CC-CFT747]|nr:two-component system activity regulator YycH [Paenibacillus sp. CC-CFT747]